MSVAARLRAVATVAAPDDTPALSRDDGRTSDRRQLRLTADAWTSGTPSTHVTVHDLSSTGFRAEGYLELSDGSEVEVDLPTVGVRKARIVWAGGRFAGCAFMAPLTTGQVRAISAAAPVVWGDFGGAEQAAPSFDRFRGLAAEPQADLAIEPRWPWQARIAGIVLINGALWAGLSAIAWAFLA